MSSILSVLSIICALRGKWLKYYRRFRAEEANAFAYDEDIVRISKTIKADIDQKVYDRNDILKKDVYFEQTVIAEIKAGLDRHQIEFLFKAG